MLELGTERRRGSRCRCRRFRSHRLRSVSLDEEEGGRWRGLAIFASCYDGGTSLWDWSGETDGGDGHDGEKFACEEHDDGYWAVDEKWCRFGNEK